MKRKITEKQYQIFYNSLKDEPGKAKKVKRISQESDTSLSHTYRCLKELKKEYVLQTGVKPMEFIRVGRLPEPEKKKREKDEETDT